MELWPSEPHSTLSEPVFFPSGYQPSPATLAIWQFRRMQTSGRKGPEEWFGAAEGQAWINSYLFLFPRPGREVQATASLHRSDGDVCASHWVGANKDQEEAWKYTYGGDEKESSSVSYGIGKNGDHKTSSQRFSGQKYIRNHPHLCGCTLWTIINEPWYRKEEVISELLGPVNNRAPTTITTSGEPLIVRLCQGRRRQKYQRPNTQICKMKHTQEGFPETRTGLVSGS